MKNLLLYAALSFLSVTTFSQASFRAGFISSLSVDEDFLKDKMVFGSVIGEINYSISGVVAATGNIGFLRVANKGEGFIQLPVLIGAKYRLNETFYFGASGGASWFFRNRGGTDFTWSGFAGANVKDWLSVDLRYLNAVRNINSIKTIAVVISYNF